jgi:hypothetical protein
VGPLTSRKMAVMPLPPSMFPNGSATSAPKSKVLELLYTIYKMRGAIVSTDSNDIADRFSIDPELVESTAVELYKRKLVTFAACDQGLINFRLTIEGIEQIENPASSADWHAGRE